LKSFGYTMAFSVGGVIARQLLADADDVGTDVEAAQQGKFPHAGRGPIYRPIERIYMRMLGFSLKRRWVIVLLCGAVMGSCIQ
jgi:hypothetical protein